MMRDLSEQGFSLRAMMPLRPTEKIPFSFALDTSARIDGEAIVLRVEDDGHVAALEFAGLPPHSRDQIRRWLDKFDEPFSPESEPAHVPPSKHTSLTELRSKIRIRKQPSVPPAAESGPPPPPPPQAITAPPKVEPTPLPFASAAEIAPPTPLPNEVTPPEIEPQPTLFSPVEASTPPSSPIVTTAPEPDKPPTPQAIEPAQQTPPPTVMALPKRFPPFPRATPPAPIPEVSPTTVEQSDTPPLPPLLKLSSVRPGLLSTEIPAESLAPVEIPKPILEPPAEIQISVPKPEPPAATETRILVPAPPPPTAPRRLIPPPLEPLSSFEGETDSDNPSWMDSFTLGRALGIMLFLTLLAGSYVYHREVGQAIIWLGHQIAGDDSPESSKVARPEIAPASRATPPTTPAPRSVEPPAPSSQKSPEISESKSANLPAASDSTPSPQLKDTSPGSLVPLTQVTKPSAQVPPADTSVEAGQQEYQEALQILRSPSRASEAPAAVQLLWVAVEKGNTGAEIDLAELFRTGRGVAKNCDQAQILLSAAARKGSVEARKRLEALRREGCGN
jgi:hypothetical protein